MPDNQQVSTNPYDVATDKVTYSGDADQNVQLFRPVHVTGAEGSKTVVDLTSVDGLAVIDAFATYGTGTSDGLAAGSSDWQQVRSIGYVFNGTTWDRLRGNTAGLWAQGNVAHDAVDSGNPVKIGGKAYSILPAVVGDGDRVDATFDRYGSLRVYLGGAGDGANVATTAPSADGVGVARGLAVDATIKVFNGTTWDRLYGNTAGLFAQGNVASGVADAGNPVKVGGVFVTAPPTLTTGQRGNLQLNALGFLRGVISDPNNAGREANVLADNASDARSNSLPSLAAAGFTYGFNGTSWDRVRVANTGRLQVDVVTAPSSATAGDVAHDAVDSGNPVKIGGKANTAIPTAVSASGDRVDAYFDSRGRMGVLLGNAGRDVSVSAANGLQVTPVSSNGQEAYIDALNSDSVSQAAIATAVQAVPLLWNGTSFARGRSASADALAATGIPASGLMGFNGTTWDRVRVANTGRLQVDVVSGGSVAQGGDVAHDGVDSGNPVKIGGRASDTAPAQVATGDRVNAWFGQSGQLITGGFEAQTGTDGLGNTQLSGPVLVSGTGSASAVRVGLMGYNGSTWDRVRTANTGRLQVDVVTGPSSATAGDVAHDAVDSGNPVKIGGKALATLPAAVAGGDRVNASFGRLGGLLVTNGPSTGGASTDSTVDVIRPVSFDGLNSLIADAPHVYNGANWDMTRSAPSADAQARTGIAASALMGFNGTTWDRVRVANTGRLQVDVVTAPSAATAGDVAHDAVDSGNPVKIGGAASNSVPTPVTNGDRVSGWFDTTGALQVGLTDTGGTRLSTSITPGNDGVGTSFTGLRVAASHGMGFNGTTWDRVRTVQDYKTAAAAPVEPLASIAPDRRFTALTLATAANSTQSWDTNGADITMLHVGSTTTGTYAIEVSADGTNWTAANVRDVVNDLTAVASGLTPTANAVYRVLTNGWRSVRVRTVTTLGATVNFTATLAANSPVIAQVITGPAPHAIGHAIASATARYTTAQTSTVLGPTVGTSQRAVVTSIQIQAGGTTAGEVQVYFGTGAYVRGTTRAIFDGYFVPSATSAPGYAQSPPVPYEGTADGEIRVTTSAAITVTVTCWYYLVG